jgi:cell division protein YceG involved in septum cleavage
MPSGNSSQRTAEDRERARAERERRRQAGGRQLWAPAGSTELASEPAAMDCAVESVVLESIAEPDVRESVVEVAFPESASEPAVPEGAVAGAVSGPVERSSSAEAQMLPPSPQPIAIPAPEPPLPPRIPPPDAFRRAAGRPSRRWPARLGVGVGIALVLAALGGAVAVVLHHSHKSKSGPPPLSIVRITIPEGETRAQIAQIAAAKGLRGSYLKASRRSKLLDPARYGAPHGTHSLEGFLFPATYELFAGASAGQLVSAQLTAVRENFDSAVTRRARALHITPYELLIVASMIEREALLAHDRGRVAAVIYNRLRLGMPLGIDSTIRYALHDFTKPLTEAQLQMDSPYNTRTHKGLPPTPISNPGLASIHAAAHPAHVPYLYYVNGADGCGELVFSTSNEQFEHDAAAYREAIARNHGRVPSCRKH